MNDWLCELGKCNHRRCNTYKTSLSENNLHTHPLTVFAGESIERIIFQQLWMDAVYLSLHTFQNGCIINHENSYTCSNVLPVCAHKTSYPSSIGTDHNPHSLRARCLMEWYWSISKLPTCPLQQPTNQSVHPVVCHCQVPWMGFLWVNEVCLPTSTG